MRRSLPLVGPRRVLYVNPFSSSVALRPSSSSLHPGQQATEFPNHPSAHWQSLRCRRILRAFCHSRSERWFPLPAPNETSRPRAIRHAANGAAYPIGRRRHGFKTSTAQVKIALDPRSTQPHLAIGTKFSARIFMGIGRERVVPPLCRPEKRPYASERHCRQSPRQLATALRAAALLHGVVGVREFEPDP